MINASSLWDGFSTMQPGKNDQSEVGFPIAIFLQRGAELSDNIGEVIIKNTCFQYENTLAAWSGAIFIALTESDSNHKSITVKPVHSNHAKSWTSLVVMDRWSLYTGKLYRENVRGSTRTSGR
jgi:hypothetical protein